MRPYPRMLRMVIALLAAAISLSSCGNSEATNSAEEPAVVEPIEGTDFGRITLTASAAERLDIQTTTVESAEGAQVVPSAAVIIDPAGAYWVYTNPEPLVYVREELVSVHEEGQRAFFRAGPTTGTSVVIVGVPELYGAEFGIGK